MRTSLAFGLAVCIGGEGVTRVFSSRLWAGSLCVGGGGVESACGLR